MATGGTQADIMRMGLVAAFGLVCMLGAVITFSSVAAEISQGTAEPQWEPKSEARSLRWSFLGTTPEERAHLEEERRHLSEAAANFGTDPTAIIGYHQLVYAHSTSTNSLRLDTATATIRLPVTPDLGLQVHMPYGWADLNHGGFTTNGAGDMTVRAGARVYASNTMALFIGADGSFPTASETLLGSGKYTIGPGGALSVSLPRLDSLFFALVEDFNSIGGDPRRAQLHYTQFKPSINTIWSERWWTEASMFLYWDWLHERRTTMNLQGELGHRFGNHWAVFVDAATGVIGRESFLGLDWSVQAGVRWVFRTPLLPGFGSTLLPVRE
jgi:hypothetical protein